LPILGSYAEIVLGLFSPPLGGDEDFQRVQLTAMHFIPVHRRLHLGLRVDGAASFGDAPFYLLPFISLRGAPILRYQGEEVAQIEAELRWQFWKRFSLWPSPEAAPPGTTSNASTAYRRSRPAASDSGTSWRGSTGSMRAWTSPSVRTMPRFMSRSAVPGLDHDRRHELSVAPWIANSPT
jgi:hypothetical protein